MNDLRLFGKRLAVSLGAAAVIACTSMPAPAREIDTHYPPDGENPLRITYYFVAPVGVLLEYLVTRPLAVFGNNLVPYEHITDRGFRGCSRERPARSCTYVVK